VTTNYHTQIATGAAANAGTINSPLGQIDAGLTNALGGSAVLAQTLKEWAESGAYEVTAATVDSDGVISSGTVKWPDGSAGTFTRTAKNATWLAVDAFTISHTTSGKTVTQAAVTRDAGGNVTAKPALTVA